MGLSPAAPPERLAVAAITGTGLFAVAAASQAHLRAFAVAIVACGAATLFARRAALGFRRYGVPSPMAIVPWGVIVRPDADDERVLPWSGVRRILVEHFHTKDVAGAPATVESYVTVETPRERLAGRAPGHVSLERLIAFLHAYQDESARPVAVDLDGNPLVGDPLDRQGITTRLLEAVPSYLASSEGRGSLSLEPMSYRDDDSRAPSLGAVRVLRDILRGTPERADARPLAALLSAEIRAESLLPDLLRLVTSVHPVVAACAKAAALRLGAEPTRVGALEEVAPFLSEEDLSALSAWVSTKPP